MLFHNGQFCIIHCRSSDIFRAVSIFIVLDDYHPIIRLIFQMGPHQNQHFIIVTFILNFCRLIKIPASTVCVAVILTRSCALLVLMLTHVLTTAQTLILCILFAIILKDFLIENLP